MATKNHVLRVATAAVGQATATIPAAGTQVPFGTTPWDNWTVVPFMFSDSDFNINHVTNELIIQGPTELAPEESVILQNFIEEITFEAYQIIVDTFSLPTAATDSTGTVIEAGTHTKLALIIEVKGIGMIYMPNCTIRWTSMTGGTTDTAKVQFSVKPFSHTALSSTSNWDWLTSDGS